MEPENAGPKAQQLVKQLMERGLSPHQIAEEMDNRVSWRSIYRWAKGEHAPQQASDLVALERLAERSPGV
jgi:IS30 family transposase